MGTKTNKAMAAIRREGEMEAIHSICHKVGLNTHTYSAIVEKFNHKDALIADQKATITTLRAHVAELRGALGEAEWGGEEKCNAQGAWFGSCPKCAGWECDGHAVGCSIHEALASTAPKGGKGVGDGE